MARRATAGAHWLWLELGVLASAGALFVWLQSRGPRTAPTKAEHEAAGAPGAAGRTVVLVLCYGAFGFGYIVPATFLPAMARELAPDPLVFGLTWPLFGLAAALSVAAVADTGRLTPATCAGCGPGRVISGTWTRWSSRSRAGTCTSGEPSTAREGKVAF